MDPWYKVATPRKEVREGRSFNPDEFAIALEQVVAGTAPEDYRDPDKFFARTCFTRALREHAAMVLRRLAGITADTAPVLTLITQFIDTTSIRLYPASLIWCLKKPGRELREKIELWLAWKRVAGEIADGTLGADFDRADRAEIQSKVMDAEDTAKDKE